MCASATRGCLTIKKLKSVAKTNLLFPRVELALCLLYKMLLASAVSTFWAILGWLFPVRFLFFVLRKPAADEMHALIAVAKSSDLAHLNCSGSANAKSIAL